MWSDFESNVVEGRYPLGKLTRSEGRCGWFETRFEEKPAIISLIESLNDETVLLERLRAAERVKDANVAAIYESGATRLRGTPLVYAVMEYTEENLEDVLRERALSADETKQAAESLLSALRAVHKERLVCGRLEAASVLAAGDTIKLRSDYLQFVPQSTAFEPIAARDVRDLGSLLHECLTQKPLKSTADGNDPSLQLLPAPFVQMVRRTLTGGATLDEIAAILRPPSVPVTPPTQAKPIQISAIGREPIKQAGTLETSPGAPLKTPLKIASAIVLLLLAGFALWALLRHTDSSKNATASNPVVVVSPETTPRRKPAAVLPPPPAEKPVAAAPAASPRGLWRVVAFTYNYQDQAEHKARTINEAHPDLKADVFSPKGSGAPFLVTLGSATDRAAAFQLRDKAIQEGLPKDTYAQNYSR